MGDGATLRRSPTWSDEAISHAPGGHLATLIWGSDPASRPPWSARWRIGPVIPPAIPIATYRLQLIGGFRFRRRCFRRALSEGARHHHLYASPFMRARKGSTHGYDVTDHAQFNQSSEAKRLRAAERRAAATRSRADPGFRAQPCRRAFRRQSLVARRAGMGSGLAHAASFDMTGSNCHTAPAAACCCRSSARPTARHWKVARSNCVTTPAKAVFRPGILSIARRSRRNVTAKSCA